MLLSLSISNCLCFSSKEYKNYDKNKINRVNYRKKKKRQFKVKYFKKNNIVKGAALLSTFALLGYLGKKCFGKNEDNNSKKKQHVDKIKKTEDKIELSEADIEFIKRNFFLVAWDDNSCWNDVFVQLLMLLSIGCNRYGANSIDNTIDEINKIRGQEYHDYCLKRKVKFPRNKRPISDDNKHYLGDGKSHSFLTTCLLGEFDGKQLNELGIVGIKCRISNRFIVPINHLKNKNFKEELMSYFFIGANVFDDTNYDTLENDKVFLDYLGDSNNKERSYIVGIEVGEKDNKYDLSGCFNLSKSKGYYPTYIVVYDDINYIETPHYFAFYIIYDDNMKVKYFLRVDGLKEEMKVLSESQAFKELNSFNKFFLLLSKGDIVKKYYVPTKQKGR